MATAIYGISHKVTGNLMTLCSCAKRDLSPPDAAAALCAALVGDKLELGMGTLNSGPFVVELSDLTVDELNVPHLDQITQNLFANLVDGIPGDGTKKPLTTGGQVASIALAAGTTGPSNSIDVKVTIPVTRETHLYASIEGKDLQTQTLQINGIGTSTATFTFQNITYTSTHKYAVLVFGTGFQAEVKYVTAP